jgi:hypothetical protein
VEAARGIDGSTGTSRPTTDPATAHHDAAGPASAHRATKRGAAGPATHLTDLRYAARPTTRTAVGHDTGCPAAGPHTARRFCAAGGAAGTDGFP